MLIEELEYKAKIERAQCQKNPRRQWSFKIPYVLEPLLDMKPYIYLRQCQ